jgi:hypothetical protein
MASFAVMLLSLVFFCHFQLSTSTLSARAPTPTPQTLPLSSLTASGVRHAPSQSSPSTPSGTPAVEVPLSANYTIIDIWVPGNGQRIDGCNGTSGPYRRTVAYTVTAHGNAVIDGDIIFGTEADILNAAVHPSLRKRAFSLTSSSSLKWPGGTVLYNYEPGLDAAHIDYFQEGVKQWTDRLPFLKFVYSNSPTARTVVASSGNRSPVGCCGGQIELCPSCNPRSARHEIGHSKYFQIKSSTDF